MKKLTLFLLIAMLVAMPLASQTLFVGNFHELYWDPEPDPLFADVTYEVGVTPDKSDVDIINQTSDTSITVDIRDYDYTVIFAVRTVWTFTQEYEIDDVVYQIGDTRESDWNFSDENGVFTPDPFVGSRDVLAPKGLRREP